LNLDPLAYHGQPPGKINHIADHFAKRATKNKDFGKIYSPQTWISFLGITLFILFDPQTPLPSHPHYPVHHPFRCPHLSMSLPFLAVPKVFLLLLPGFANTDNMDNKPAEGTHGG